MSPILWVKKFKESTPTTSTKEIQKGKIGNYISHIKKTHEEWQIVQANSMVSIVYQKRGSAAKWINFQKGQNLT